MGTKVWAHRGASGYAPENTLEAFKLAAGMGADGVELDVQLTKDGELVVFHDETLERVTDGSGWLKDYTLKELKKRKVKHDSYKKAKIPTLKEVYELLAPTGLEINVELKTGVIFYEEIEKKVLKLSQEMGMEHKIWYSSFNHYTLMALKKLDPTVRTGILYADGIVKPWKYAVKTVGADALHPALYNMQFPDYLKKSRKKGLETHVWTVNEEKDMRMLAEAGVEAIITNYPDIAKKIVGEYQ